MRDLLLVALGGAMGAVARWKVSGWVLHHSVDWRFPLPTFVVNAAGCLVAGLLAGLVIRREALSMEAQLFLFTGFLGGFTTFSAFGVESVHLLRRGEAGLALLYMASSLAAGVLGVWIGIWITTRFGSSNP